ncbi:ABC transporter ATP-binding protein [Candidatus Pacearchaeota archaeon]|nr:ABC transporter ATP-binding protein [Candidatus Pacearchaeota archaeon]
MDDQLIQFKDVTKRFGKNTILDSINLTIPEGKITGIIGASGEGKTTILKLIISFYKPTKGKVYYLRREISKDIVNISKFFGFATEDGSFYEKLSVRENIYHFGKLYGVKNKVIKNRAKEIIELVGLTKATKTLAEDLSIGMKKRLDLACTLIHKPTVLILDEPTADLDPLLRAQMLHLIKKINSHGTTVVITTQLLKEAEEICDKIAILYNEKIIEQNTPEKIKSKYKASNLNDVFNKIFSKRNRTTYQESSEKKSKLSLLNKNEPKKETLITNTEELKKIIEKKQEKFKDKEETNTSEENKNKEKKEENKSEEVDKKEINKEDKPEEKKDGD